MTISNASDRQLQKMLQDAYEEKKIKGKALQTVRDLIERRNLYGKSRFGACGRRREVPKTTEGLVNAYRNEVARQQLLIKKANLCERRLLIIVTALKECFADENFVTLLRAEGLETLPKFLAERIEGAES